MINDTISTKEKIEQLREELSVHYQRKDFMRLQEYGRDHASSAWTFYWKVRRRIFIWVSWPTFDFYK
jgi:hypothetical protein